MFKIKVCYNLGMDDRLKLSEYFTSIDAFWPRITVNGDMAMIDGFVQIIKDYDNINQVIATVPYDFKPTQNRLITGYAQQGISGKNQTPFYVGAAFKAPFIIGITKDGELKGLQQYSCHAGVWIHLLNVSYRLND